MCPIKSEHILNSSIEVNPSHPTFNLWKYSYSETVTAIIRKYSGAGWKRFVGR